MFEEYVTLNRQLIKVRESMREYKVYPVRIRRALSFDGVDDGVVVSDNAILRPESFTITGWLKWAGTQKNAAGPLVGKREGSAGYMFMARNDRTMTLAINGWTDFFTPAMTVKDNNWSFVAGIYDRINMKMKICIDGVWAEKTTTVTLVHTTRSLAVGRENGISTYYELNGCADEVRIYSRVLSAEEVAWLYNNGKGRPGRVGIRGCCVLCLDPSRWRGSGWVKDISGCGNHGQIYGAVRVPRGF